jgi:hypothetical protein
MLITRNLGYVSIEDVDFMAHTNNFLNSCCYELEITFIFVWFSANGS